MDYEKKTAFKGDPGKAMELAKSMFIQSGYRIVNVSDTEITASHEGAFIKSVSGSTIYGASPVTVGVTDGLLSVKSDFEGVEKTKKFIVRMILGLSLLLGVMLGVPFGIIFDEKWPMILGIGLGAGIPLLQLPIHFYVTPWIMKKRAINALDTMVHNITMLAK